MTAGMMYQWMPTFRLKMSFNLFASNMIPNNNAHKLIWNEKALIFEESIVVLACCSPKMHGRSD